jgi:hypothetical protein
MFLFARGVVMFCDGGVYGLLLRVVDGICGVGSEMEIVELTRRVLGWEVAGWVGLL